MTGQQLREHRQWIGDRRALALSAQEFALILDVPYSTYRRWEAAHGQIPRHAASLVRAYLMLARRDGRAAPSTT